MSDKRKILIQLDSDPHPSVFDRIAALDAGAEEVFSYGGVKPEDVQNLVFGAVFTRGPKDLKNTAVFIGGSSVAVGEQILHEAQASFFGPLRVSLMLDANGANTTAAAAVLAARKHHALEGAKALVLGGTGPVGQRAALMLASEGAEVHVGSRQHERAAAVCNSVAKAFPNATLVPVATGSPEAVIGAMAHVQIVIAAGAPGAVLLPRAAYAQSRTLQVAVDLNAVPPLGIEGIDSTDAGIDRDGVKCYGAIGVGGTKMKIHKTCIAHLFERNDLLLDAREIYGIGKGISPPGLGMIAEQIAAGARTVAHLATYFEELKQTARTLREQFGARQRGYFTPSEDEAVRRLLISYWQARNALFDLVVSYHDDSGVPADVRPPEFLVAYAAAILLVDAARFLREMYDDCSAIVTKLNEPEPHFGIPPGTYDTVQESLTNPKNAWHLYHATQYFTQHERELRELAGNELLAPVVAVIDRLGHRMQVSAHEYASARLRVRTQLAQSGLRWTLIERALYGLQKIACLMVSDVRTRRGHRPGLPPGVAAELRGLLQPGDVLVTRKEHVMTNYFLPGYWPHAALFLGDSAALERLGIHEHAELRPRWSRMLALDVNEPRRVLEALKDGVWIRSLSSPFGSDAIAALRPRLAASDVAQAIGRGMFHEGKSYDFDFDFTRSDRLVCTEVVYRSYEGIGGVRFDLSRRAGRLTLAAEDLLRMALDRNVFEPLAVFAPTRASSLLSGRDADDALRATMAGS